MDPRVVQFNAQLASEGQAPLNAGEIAVYQAGGIPQRFRTEWPWYWILIIIAVIIVIIAIIFLILYLTGVL